MKYPAVVCHKCQKPLQPHMGHWVHRYPDRRMINTGYHVPQIIAPIHYASEEAWSRLIMKQNGWGGMSIAKFWNEVMGEVADEGYQLVTEAELRDAACLPWTNKEQVPDPLLMRSLEEYRTRILAVDWGGGGADEISYTVVALMGLRQDGHVDVLWGKRLMLAADHVKESAEVLRIYQQFRCDAIAHDYTGAGTVRESTLMMAGMPANKIWPVLLTRTTQNDMWGVSKPSTTNHRSYFTLDKARSLLNTCHAIKLKVIRFFQFDWRDDSNCGLIIDFTALREEKMETRVAGDIYRIVREATMTDDFAQAVNIGASALWAMHQCWPDLGMAAGMARINEAAFKAAGNFEYGWENEGYNSPFFRE